MSIEENDIQMNQPSVKFGFTENAELVNGRLAMFGFLMLTISELIYHGEPVTRKIFGIG